MAEGQAYLPTKKSAILAREMMTWLDGQTERIEIQRNDTSQLLNTSSSSNTMNSRLITVFVTLGCVFLASCYPYDESQQQRPTRKQAARNVASPNPQQIQEPSDSAVVTEITAPAEAPKKEAAIAASTAPAAPKTATAPTKTPEAPKPRVEEKRPEYSVANKVPGKEGFVFSPYNNKVVDVRDIPSGTLVQDPTYTGAGKGYFRVP
jgi:hypothetical protein